MKKRNFTLDQFLKLPKQEQYAVIFEDGIFVEKRKEKNKIYALYSLYLFFVELEYGNKENIIVAKYAFESGTKLDRYVSFDGKKLMEEI